jgi:CHAT domain-containing protein/predicted negative regulator of RcsB-dependent stress response
LPFRWNHACLLLIALSLFLLRAISIPGAFAMNGKLDSGLGSSVFCILSQTKEPYLDLQQNVDALNLRNPISREMNGGDVHAYRIVLAKDEFVHVLVEQQGINVALALFDPDHKLIGEMDSPNNTLGPEHISLVPETTGEYRLEVRSTEKWANPGRYLVSITDLRPATAMDNKRVAAERGFMEAEAYSNPREEDLQKQKMSLAQSRQQAIETYKKTLADWQALDDAHGEAMTYYRIGANYKLLGDSDRAIENFDNGLRALKNRAPEQDWRLAAGILNDAGVVYIGNDVQKALGLFEQAKQLFEAHNDNRGLASSYNNIGVAFHSSGNIREALDNYLKSLPIRKAEHQLSSEINLENNIGGIYDSFGDPHLALEHYQRALDLWRENKNRDKVPLGLNNVAKVQDELGEWQEAKNKYEEALALYSGDKTGEASTLVNLGTLYDTLGDPETALEKFNAALVAVASVKNTRLTANILTRIGQVNVTLGKLDDALKSYGEALNVEGELRPVAPSSRASTLTGIGAVMALRGDPQKALEYYLEALNLRTQVGDRRGRAVTLDRMGGAYALAGEPQKAIDSFEQAVPIWRSIEDRLGLASSLGGIARLELVRGNLLESLKLSGEAVAIVEGLRTKVSSQQLRTSYFAAKQNYYELEIDLNMRLYRENQSSRHLALALQASERSRARSLMDTLGEGRSNITEGSSEDLVRLEGRLRAKSEARTTLLSTKHTDSEAAAIAKEVIDLSKEYDETRDGLRAKSKKYADLTQAEPLNLLDIQKQLLGDDLLLEYSLGNQHSYAWAVTPDSIKGIELKGRKEIEATAERMNTALRERNHQGVNDSPQQIELHRNKADAEYSKATAELSKMVIQPVAALLGKKRLVIVADGALQLVSFGALSDPNGAIPSAESTATTRTPRKTGATNDPKPLLENHEIVYEASASVLALQRKEFGSRQGARHALAVLADPVFDQEGLKLELEKRRTAKARERQSQPGPDSSESSREARARSRSDLTRAIDDMGIGSISPLPESRNEAAAIMKVVPKGEGMSALGFDASRATVMSPTLSQYRIIHFATHGFADLDHPELSGIVLSLIDAKGQPQDGFLRLHDIYNLNLPADLVVLSACQTGVGKQIKGEGLIALTRGFTYAGAASVVASLWKVDDEATKILMEEFYKQMFVNGLQPAAALQKAQLKLAHQSQWRSPFYWAGFVLQGEWK